MNVQCLIHNSIVLRENVGVCKRKKDRGQEKGAGPGDYLHLISWETNRALGVPSDRCAHNSSHTPCLPGTSDAFELICISDKSEGSIFWEWIEAAIASRPPRRMTVDEVKLTA